MSWFEVVFLDEVRECAQCDYSVTNGACLVFFENTDKPGHTTQMTRQLYHLLFAGGTYYHEKRVRERMMWALPRGAWSLISAQEVSQLPDSLTDYAAKRASTLFEPLGGYCRRPSDNFCIAEPVGPLPLEVKLIEFAGNGQGEIKKERKTKIEYWTVRIFLK